MNKKFTLTLTSAVAVNEVELGYLIWVLTYMLTVNNSVNTNIWFFAESGVAILLQLIAMLTYPLTNDINIPILTIANMYFWKYTIAINSKGMFWH